MENDNFDLKFKIEIVDGKPCIVDIIGNIEPLLNMPDDFKEMVLKKIAEAVDKVSKDYG